MARQNRNAKTCITFARVKSPVGEIVLASKGDALCALEFADAEKRMVAWLRRRFGDFERVEAADPGGVCTRLGAYSWATSRRSTTSSWTAVVPSSSAKFGKVCGASLRVRS